MHGAVTLRVPNGGYICLSPTPFLPPDSERSHQEIVGSTIKLQHTAHAQKLPQMGGFRFRVDGLGLTA